MSKIVHKLIAKTAKEIAAEVYEVCASNDRFFSAYPSQGRFVRQQWQQFIGDARKALTAMLVTVPGTERDPDGPKYRHSQHIRDEVFEALVTEGQMKSAPPLDLSQLRINAGMDPMPRPLPGLH